MSSRKKSTSTESSSGSTSDSSSNSSSSSSESGSGSSSSDSDSSSSQEVTTNKTNRNQNTNVQSSKTNDKSVRRRSSETNSLKQSQSNDKNNSTKSIKDKNSTAVSSGNKSLPPSTKLSNNNNSNNNNNKNSAIYSSDEEVPVQKNNQKIQNDVQNKKKSQAVLKPKHPMPTNTGGKAPPAIVKQVKMSNSKALVNNKRTVEKSSSSSSAGNSSSSKSKKKSIFSPDNSSESDDENRNRTSKSLNHQPRQLNSNKNSSQGRAKEKETQNSRAKQQKVIPKEKIPVQKSSESSETSSSSGSTSSSDSDSESSTESSTPQKKTLVKRNTQKQQRITDTSKNNSDSDLETPTKPSVVRKLTRSASTRKSRHLTGKIPSETESDGDGSVKRSVSKSPVKKTTTTITKGKAKNKRTDVKTSDSNKTAPIPEERKCSLEGCDSTGHLGGQFDKHFTIDACPLYHNLSLSQTKDHLIERKKREDERKKMMENLNSMNSDFKKPIQTVDQKMYLQRIKEMRAKFKSNPISSLINNTNGEKEREADLNGHVCDYDLQLFREAQAIASENIENELKEIPASKGTKYITMGKHCMEVWYQSPYPADAARLPKLYICEFCLRYQKSKVGMKRHAAKCVWRHPPGDEIYRKGKLGVWQVDGKRHKQYCQHLCLLAKFFLDHKTLYYDVEPFLFYVMTLADSEGCHTVGYFSKEKNSFLNYNVSCILTLPPYQRKGYGRLLIDFSYLLTRVEGKIGSPEKPLSDLGLISYRSYWKDVLLDYLCTRSGTALSIKDVSQEMAINSYDIVSTLQALGMMKYWKGKHIILKKQDVLEEYAERVKKRGAVMKIDPEYLRWTPFIPPAQTGPS